MGSPILARLGKVRAARRKFRPYRSDGAFARVLVLSCAGFLGVVVIAAIFAGQIAPHDPLVGRLQDRALPPAWSQGGRWTFPLGTDLLGRDILSRLVFGTRDTLVVGLVAVLTAGVFGSAVGVVAGYFDRLAPLLMRTVDVVQGLPLVLMAIVMVALLGPSLINILMVITFFLWPYYARQVRAEVLSLKQAPFVDLARVAGCPNHYIIVRHLLPNVAPTLYVLASLQVSVVVLLEASLSFIGIGVPPPTPTWGLMISEGRGVIDTAWWVSFWPGLALSVTVFAITILSDWTRERTDPRVAR